MKKSKFEICTELYDAWDKESVTRVELIEKFVEASGATKISATKYFQVLNRAPKTVEVIALYDENGKRFNEFPAAEVDNAEADAKLYREAMGLKVYLMKEEVAA